MQSVQNHLGPRSRSPKSSYMPPSYHPSLSGSDTDVSTTSTENLTIEEKRVLQKGIRQEPQGEETIAEDPDAISSNTLIIHEKIASDHTSPFYSQNFHQPTKSIDKTILQAYEAEAIEKYKRLYSDTEHHIPRNITPEHQHIPRTITPEHHLMQSRNITPEHHLLQPRNITPEHHLLQPRNITPEHHLLQPRNITPEHHLLQPRNSTPEHHLLQPRNSTPEHQFIPPRNSTPVNQYPKPPMHSTWEQYGEYTNQTSPIFPQNQYLYAQEPSVQGLTEIPKDYLDQSEVLKYLAKELNHQNILSELNYRSEYPQQNVDHRQVILGNARRRGYGMLNARSKSADRLTVTRSHPDLSRSKHYHSEDNSAKLSQEIQRSENHIRPGFGVESAQQANQVIELLSAENTALKAELDLNYKKVSKLQKFELEIQKVHKAYEDLVQSSEKRERLERSIRSRLEVEIRRLQEHNKQLREHLESAGSHFTKPPVSFSEESDSETQKELSKREVLISQLLSQTKELHAEKERQEIELQAQRATLQEQRNHIDILDNALTNAQANVVRLEDESRKKQVYVDRVAQLQKALTNLQQSSEKRLQVERKLRAQHEKEVQALRSQNQGKLPMISKNDSLDNVETLKKTVMEYEEKIIGLEAEVSKWEQRYIAESTMRQIAVDAASVPKDAKIAALERTSQESEKLIAQARTEKLKHMDELYAANRKTTELESRIKDFESKLAEKDAMIKVLQQHSQDKDTVFQNCVLGRPPRHTRAASTVGITTSTSHTTTTTGCSSLGRVSPSPTNTLHRRTGSASGSLLSITSESSSTVLSSPPSPVADSATAKKSLDEQLKELDSRLSSKDSIISALRAEKERYPSHFWRV